jgi:hypothetical protein
MSKENFNLLSVMLFIVAFLVIPPEMTICNSIKFSTVAVLLYLSGLILFKVGK